MSRGERSGQTGHYVCRQEYVLFKRERRDEVCVCVCVEVKRAEERRRAGTVNYHEAVT